MIHQKAGDETFCPVLNGVQAGQILVDGIGFGRLTGGITGWTIDCIEFTGHGITHRLAGHVLDQEPG